MMPIVSSSVIFTVVVAVNGVTNVTAGKVAISVRRGVSVNTVSVSVLCGVVIIRCSDFDLLRRAPGGSSERQRVLIAISTRIGVNELHRCSGGHSVP